VWRRPGQPEVGLLVESVAVDEADAHHVVERAAPRLDSANAAPGGRWFDIPLTVTHQSGATAAPVHSLRVEASSDDGRTWHRADLHGTVARVHNPASGFVSLRVTTASFTETVIRAYAIR
jgi:hypothetical protein